MNRPLLFAMLLFQAGATLADTAIYDDNLDNGFQDWSWATHALDNPAPVFEGQFSIRFEPDNWEALYFSRNGAPLQLGDFAGIRLHVHGGSGGGQALRFNVLNGAATLAQLDVDDFIDGGTIVAGSWREVFIPFAAGTGLVAGGFDAIQIQDFSGGEQEAVYLDAIVLVDGDGPGTPGAITIDIDRTLDRRPINAQVFGVNFGSDAQQADLRWPVRRWGGNSASRYNWQADVHNTGADWFFMNIADGDGNNLPHGSTVNAFLDHTRQHGGQPLLTVPTIGWTPRPERIKRWGFSQALYGAQNQDECDLGDASWCIADAGNGECAGLPGPYCVNGRIVGNDPADTSIAITPAFVGEWVDYLVDRYGGAAGGGLRYYALDNEFSLWHHTHRDVRPDPVGYDELWQRMRDHAGAIKAADPAAQTFGPVTWGWCDLHYSPLDPGGCSNGPDRQAHGDLPLLAWVLQQNCSDPLPGGARVIDFLDVHYYPQGGMALNDDETLALAARRLRSLRELWDPGYVAESWINQPVALIPTLKQWIDQYCPGTRLAITEYHWGGDQGLSSAVAQTEVLALFAREGVDLATRWVAPEQGSKVEDAFRLFLDYDGANGRIEGDSVRATSPDIDRVGAFAIHDPGSGRLFVILTNKSLQAQTVTLALAQAATGNWTLYGLDGAAPFGPRGSGVIDGDSLVLPAMPARSARLLVLPAGDDVLFANGFETTVPPPAIVPRSH